MPHYFEAVEQICVRLDNANNETARLNKTQYVAQRFRLKELYIGTDVTLLIAPVAGLSLPQPSMKLQKQTGSEMRPHAPPLQYYSTDAICESLGLYGTMSRAECIKNATE
jgi:hypothetical protein